MSQVSVIITTYNRAGLLGQALASVLRQTISNFEILIIDDGSRDDNRAVVGMFSDDRIQYFYQNNAGLAAARNAGIRQSQGEYIAFLDDDDMWLPEKLAVQTQILDGNPEIGLVTTGYQTINHEGKMLSEVRPWIHRPNLDLQTWLYACPTVPSAVMVRRQWLERVGNFDEEISREAGGSEDWDLWLRLAYSGCSMAWTEEILCAYRIHAESMSQNSKRQSRSMILVLDKLYKRPDLSQYLQENKSRIYSMAYIRAAARLYVAGLTEDAEFDLVRAIQLNPGLLDKNGEELFNTLVGWTGNPLVKDPRQFLECVFDHLPVEAAVLVRRKQEAYGLVTKGDFFEAYQMKDWKKVRRSLVQIARHRPGLLLDRGVISVTLEMIIGRQAIQQLKKIQRRARLKS